MTQEQIARVKYPIEYRKLSNGLYQGEWRGIPIYVPNNSKVLNVYSIIDITSEIVIARFRVTKWEGRKHKKS